MKTFPMVEYVHIVITTLSFIRFGVRYELICRLNFESILSRKDPNMAIVFASKKRLARFKAHPPIARNFVERTGHQCN